MATSAASAWKKSACILCSLGCGVELQTEGRHIQKVRGDRAHPSSRGYACEKAQRLDAYQNGPDRLETPLRRRPDGTYEAIDWDTAFREVGARLNEIKAHSGGDAIFYYGGGGQGNHLCGTYADATLKALGVRFRSNALAQEKTGEAWVQGKMMGTGIHGDFEHCQVAVFVGKNPWHSHGFPRAREVLQAIRRDPSRTMIVIDPRRSETAAMADLHLALRPGTDAWCLAALAALIVQEGLTADAWLAEHTQGAEGVLEVLRHIPVEDFAQHCGLSVELLRQTARTIAQAESVAMLEDLGIQMNRHSTLSSYLNRLVWLLTGHFGRRGTNNPFVPFLSLSQSNKGGEAGQRLSPVTQSRIIMGLVPCNVIPEEILTDHPGRFRAMIIESANPVHSLADTPRMVEALRALDLSVVIDVAFTETARQADYVLPACSQFEKAEAAFFNLEFPMNALQVRPAALEPLPGTLEEGEIHARLLESMGILTEADYTELRLAAQAGLETFASAFMQAFLTQHTVAKYASVILYRTLGSTLPPELKHAASVWGLCQTFVQRHPDEAARAGFAGEALDAGNRLFQAFLKNPSGVVFSVSLQEESFQCVRRPGNRIQLFHMELLAELEGLKGGPEAADPAFPFILSVGERRSETHNTVIRSADGKSRGFRGALRMNPTDATRLDVHDGAQVRITTSRGHAVAWVEVSESLQPGHVSLPNGQGLDIASKRVSDTLPSDGIYWKGETLERKGVALNELTDHRRRDVFAGTPWHKYVPARIERLPVNVGSVFE